MGKSNTNKVIKTPEIQLIYGIHSVKAALKNLDRVHFELLILKKHQNLLNKIQTNPSRIKILNHKEMLKLYGSENVTQGIVLKTNLLDNINLEKFLKKEHKENNSLILVLDQVTDPQNIGSIMRSCAMFNCKAILISKDNSPEMTPSLIKAASGAAEIVDYIKVVNLKRALLELKKNGYWVYGFDNTSKDLKDNINFAKKSVLVFGSEGKGIRDLIKKECDEILALKCKPNSKYGIDSLNVSNASSIALYEYFKIYGN